MVISKNPHVHCLRNLAWEQAVYIILSLNQSDI